MEVTRTRVDDLRVRQLQAQQMLRGELEDKDLEEFVKQRLLFSKFETRPELGAQERDLPARLRAGLLRDRDDHRDRLAP